MTFPYKLRKCYKAKKKKEKKRKRKRKNIAQYSIADFH